MRPVQTHHDMSPPSLIHNADKARRAASAAAVVCMCNDCVLVYGSRLYVASRPELRLLLLLLLLPALQREEGEGIPSTKREVVLAKTEVPDDEWV